MKSSFKFVELILIFFLANFFLGFQCTSNMNIHRGKQGQRLENYANGANYQQQLFYHPHSTGQNQNQNPRSPNSQGQSQVNFYNGVSKHVQNAHSFQPQPQFYRSSSSNESIYPSISVVSSSSSFPPAASSSSFASTYPMSNPENNQKKPEEIPVKPAPKPKPEIMTPPEIPLPPPPQPQPIPIPKPGFGFGFSVPLPPPFAPPRPPEELVSVGFDKIVLLVVPQFKIPIKTKKWWKADVKLSLPITVFFDKLVVPVNSPPLIFFPFGPVGVPPQRPPSKPSESQSENQYGNRNEYKQKNPSSNSNARTKRSSNPILSLPPPESVKGGERAMLVSRLENIVESFGMEGRSCVLRAVCEVHQHSLHKSYGFLGEIITLLLTVSNSAYAESHLPEYFKAEQLGKDGDGCHSYFPNCTESILHHHNHKQNHKYNHADDDDDLEEELEYEEDF